MLAWMPRDNSRSGETNGLGASQLFVPEVIMAMAVESAFIKNIQCGGDGMESQVHMSIIASCSIDESCVGK